MALRDAGRVSIAYFYFDFRDVDKQNLHKLLPSLLIQLSTRSDHCLTYFLDSILHATVEYRNLTIVQ